MEIRSWEWICSPLSVGFSVWLLLAAVSPPPFILANQNTFPKQAVSGVYVQDLPIPIFYDTFLPLILEYVLPHWNKSDVTFNNWYNCTSETLPYRYTCPSVFHMNKAILKLHIDFLALQPVTDAASHSDYYDNLLSHPNFCNLVQRHFSGIFIQDDELSAYIRALEKCNTDLQENDSALVVFERSLQEFNFSIRHPFTKMESNFYNIFYKSITGTNNGTLDLVASATLSNARSTIQGTLLSFYYAEKYRWSHAVQDCSAQRIPHSLITNANFEERLDELSKRERFLNNLNYVIPMSLISKYFSIPITDCTYTNETFVVRIQLPVKAKVKANDVFEAPSPPPRLVTLTPATFGYKSKICSVQVDSQQLYAYDGTNIAYRTNCKSNELCLNSETFAHRFVDHCATALLNQNFEEVITYCTFKCVQQIRTSMFGEEPGEVIRAGNDKFIITGHGTKAVVHCHTGGSSSPPSSGIGQSPASVLDAKEEATEFSVDDAGALEVTLPSECNMEVNRQRFYPSGINGSHGALTIISITPWHLVKEEDKAGEDLRPDESLLKFYTAEIGVRSDNAGVPGSAEASKFVQESSSLVPLWLFFGFTSTILFLIQLYIIYLLRQSNAAGGNYPMHQLLYKARDPEPQVGLLENNDPYETM